MGKKQRGKLSNRKESDRVSKQLKNKIQTELIEVDADGSEGKGPAPMGGNGGDLISAVTVIDPTPSRRFVETPFIKDLTQRALYYLRAGFPVHLRGVSGVGKTTLALRFAQLINRPTVIIHGDEEIKTGDLVGTTTGYQVRKMRDNFVHSVLKVEEETTKKWVDAHLTVAAEKGYTLIYDEFTRSRPEANNVLLSVLQEGMLSLPLDRPGDRSYLQVHPEFRAIFTSNPEEYAGVHKTQDALRDRMITLDLLVLDEHTEIAITRNHSGLPLQDVVKIVKVVRALRKPGVSEYTPTVRACVMIAKTLRVWKGVAVSQADSIFRKICVDILASGSSRLLSPNAREKVEKAVSAAIYKYCSKAQEKTIQNAIRSVQSGKTVRV